MPLTVARLPSRTTHTPCSSRIAFSDATAICSATSASQPLDVSSQYDSSRISHLLGCCWLHSRKNVRLIISSARQLIDQVGPTCILAFFSFSVLVSTAAQRGCPEHHPADTAGVRTDEHVKEHRDYQESPVWLTHDFFLSTLAIVSRKALIISLVGRG